MTEFFTRLFDTSGFPARWHGGDWTAGHGWLHILSDLGIWSAYFAIPLVLSYVVVRRRDLPFRSIFPLFVASFLLCGTTHLMEAVIFWWPAYRLAGVIKLLTVAVSWSTVFALVRATPNALAMGSPEEPERDIAARRQAEEALQRINADPGRRVEGPTAALTQAVATLRDEREWLRTTLASIGDGVIATDAEGAVTFLNGVAEALTGWTIAEARGVPLARVFQIINERTREQAKNPALRALREGVIVGLANHSVLLGKDGAERPIDDSAAPIRDDGGEIRGAVLVFRDVTERRTAERSARFLASIIESSDDAIIGKDVDGIITSWNRAAERIFGYSAGEAVGRPIAILAPPDRADEMPAILARIRRGERVEHFDTVRRGKDGRLVPISLTVSPIHDEDGRVVGASKIARDISERKRAEEALREEKTRLHTTLLGIGDAVIVTDSEGRITLMNPVAQAVTGWEGEATGRPLEEVFRIVNEQTRRPVESPVARVLREGTVVGLANHTVLIAKDGTEVPISDSGAPIHGPDGEIVSVVLVFRDDTEKRRAEQELQESKSRLDALITNAPIGIALFDTQLRFIDLNERAAGLDGIPKAAHLGKTVPELLPGIGPEVESSLRQVRDTGEPILDLEVTGETPAAPGQQRSWIANYFPVRAEGGRLLALGAVILEITERKRAEERLRLLWEAASVLLATTDPDAMLRELFARVGPQLGLDAYFNYMVNQTGDALRLESCAGIPEEAVEGITRMEFGQAICGTVALHRQPLVVSHIQQSDDPEAQLVKSFGIRAYACNPLMADGKLLGTLSFASRSKDQFDRGDLEILQTLSRYVAVAYERGRLVRQLRQADRRKDEFLATLAHELRNPLSPIRSAVEVLKAKGPPDPDLTWGRDVIDRQSKQMARLLDDLLDVSRITRNKLELRKQRVELAAVVEDVVETGRPLIEAGGLDLAVALPDEPVYLDADPVRLAQVFANLLNNAAKYTDRGGHIRLTAERVGQEAIISVQDTGIGIAPEMLPRLFEMFSQAAPALERSQGGLGIGLSLVKGLVEMHGGTIEARSNGPGKGSRFVVRLPVTLPPRAPEQRPADEEKVRPAGCRVLVADDNRDAADSLASMLRLAGNEVGTAYDGQEAVEAAAAFRPDVILLDIGMPRLNGYDAARRIRQEPWGKEMMLVALTGWGQEEDKRRASEAGFNSHMVKPVDPAALEELLGTVAPRRE